MSGYFMTAITWILQSGIAQYLTKGSKSSMSQIDYRQVQKALREVLSMLPNPDEIEAMPPGQEKSNAHWTLEHVMDAMWRVRSVLTGKTTYELWEELKEK